MRALACYQKALDMNIDDGYQMYHKIQKRMKQLEKPVRATKKRTVVTKDVDKKFEGTLETHGEE
jgi:hypothetical protein